MKVFIAKTQRGNYGEGKVTIAESPDQDFFGFYQGLEVNSRDTRSQS